MLPFANALTNEESAPGAQPWYAVVFLVLTNLVGVAAAWYARRIACFFQAWALAGSVAVSIAYHLCRDAQACLGLDYDAWMRADHFSALLVLALAPLFVVNLAYPRAGRPPPARAVDLMLHDEWSVASTYGLALATLLATLAAPFSFQAFIVVAVLALAAAYVGVGVLGHTRGLTRARLVVGDLALGAALGVAGLALFIVDSVVGESAYVAAHTLWHALIYAAYFFFLTGLSHGLPGALAVTRCGR